MPLLLPNDFPQFITVFLQQMRHINFMWLISRKCQTQLNRSILFVFLEFLQIHQKISISKKHNERLNEPLDKCNLRTSFGNRNRKSCRQPFCHLFWPNLFLGWIHGMAPNQFLKNENFQWFVLKKNMENNHLVRPW